MILVGALAAFLYYPRASSVASAADAATLAILNTAIDGSRGGAAFAAARDGEIYRSGDLVRANTEGRAVLTFFDGSSLSVDPGSQVKVTALNKVPGEGIQVAIEQTLGRSWSAVQKLRTPDSRFEVRTPSSTAAVRGTGFLTLVQPLPTGGTQTTFQADEGALQVTIAEGAAAPAAPTPIPPSPHLEIGATTGLSFLAVSPSGAACGPAGSKSEIFGCVATGDKISIRDPAPGRWGLYLTSATADSPVLTVDMFTGSTRSGGRALSRPFGANEQVRSGFTLTAGPPVALSTLEEGVAVTSVCAALAPGRVFASGAVESRLDGLRAFALTNRGVPVAIVYTQGELNQAASTGTPSAQGLTLSNTKLTIDPGGIHGTARAATSVVTVDASADLVGGPVSDKFSVHVSRMSADPLPPGLVDFVKGLADTGAAALTDTLPFLVRRVSFRSGCLFVAGVTPF